MKAGTVLAIWDGMSNTETRVDTRCYTTVEPVRGSGWYELTDGTVAEFVWRNGRPEIDQRAHNWAAVAEIKRKQSAALY